MAYFVLHTNYILETAFPPEINGWIAKATNYPLYGLLQEQAVFSQSGEKLLVRQQDSSSLP